MVTEKEFKEAIGIVQLYIQQKNPIPDYKKTSDIGARVVLSSYGKEMQRPHKKIGTVISWLQWMHFQNDGIVTVLWDGSRKPIEMHVSQVELYNKK